MCRGPGESKAIYAVEITKVTQVDEILNHVRGRVGGGGPRAPYTTAVDQPVAPVLVQKYK